MRFACSLLTPRTNCVSACPQPCIYRCRNRTITEHAAQASASHCTCLRCVLRNGNKGIVMSEPVVVGRDLRKTFRRDTGETVHALDGISFEVTHGTLTALVGPDGAGKTTLLRLITGLMVADAGELSV